MRRLAAALASAVVIGAAGATPAVAGIDDVETPTVSGPIPATATSYPWAATDKPLDQYGYVEEEFKYSGNAFRYDTSGAIDADGTRITTGGPADDGKFPYTTRMIVRRPANAADFNGTVVVEWQNVTAGFEAEWNWFGDPEFLLRNGYAWIGISSQRIGVNHLRGWNPSRYGDLDVSARDGGTETVTNDALSYEIYSAGIKALLDGAAGADPLGPLAKPSTVIASGESQSGSRLSTYYNKVLPLHEIVDAFLLTVSSAPVRDDRPEKVIRVLSETENRIPRTEPDDNSYRQWEVAGGSHLPRMAYDNFQGPITRDTGGVDVECERFPLSLVQWPLVVNSAYRHLEIWSGGGDAPPIAPRGEYVPGASPPDQLKRNDLGLAEGGIRLPEMSVPARLNTGSNSASSAPGTPPLSVFCILLGSSEDFTDAVLLNLYDDFGDYIDQVVPKAQEVADQGFILPQDIGRLVDMHKAVPTIRPTPPRLASGDETNRGTFELSWRGTQAPQSTFEVEHSKDGGETWSAVSRATALEAPQLTFLGTGERSGRWIYRVRSNTTIPANVVQDEYVVTTPWSEASGPVQVDRTKPKLKLRCPKKVERGERAFARIKARDRHTGLRKDPSGKKRIRTGRKGTVKIKAKAVDQLGNKRTKSCRVRIVKR